MTEKKITQSRSHIAMEKKMVHELLRLLAHATSVYHDNMCFLRLSKVRIFPRATDHEKKAAPEGAWVYPTLLGKASTYRTNQGVEKRLDLE
jgi:hypothetical protein